MLPGLNLKQHVGHSLQDDTLAPRVIGLGVMLLQPYLKKQKNKHITVLERIKIYQANFQFENLSKKLQLKYL